MVSICALPNRLIKPRSSSGGRAATDQAQHKEKKAAGAIRITHEEHEHEHAHAHDGDTSSDANGDRTTRARPRHAALSLSLFSLPPHEALLPLRFVRLAATATCKFCIVNSDGVKVNVNANANVGVAAWACVLGRISFLKTLRHEVAF